MARIRAIAADQITSPLKSPHIDVEILFAARDRTARADVDNIAKLILDALKGLV